MHWIFHVHRFKFLKAFKNNAQNECLLFLLLLYKKYIFLYLSMSFVMLYFVALLFLGINAIINSTRTRLELWEIPFFFTQRSNRVFKSRSILLFKISHRILFQAPAVVSKKVYIPPTLVALFHYSNVSLKSFFGK